MYSLDIYDRVRWPMLDGYVGVIDEILWKDKVLIKKQRHTPSVFLGDCARKTGTQAASRRWPITCA